MALLQLSPRSKLNHPPLEPRLSKATIMNKSIQKSHSSYIKRVCCTDILVASPETFHGIPSAPAVGGPGSSDAIADAKRKNDKKVRWAGPPTTQSGAKSKGFCACGPLGGPDAKCFKTNKSKHWALASWSSPGFSINHFLGVPSSSWIVSNTIQHKYVVSNF